jgi:hypothetical protein
LAVDFTAAAIWFRAFRLGAAIDMAVPLIVPGKGRRISPRDGMTAF